MSDLDSLQRVAKPDYTISYTQRKEPMTPETIAIILYILFGLFIIAGFAPAGVWVRSRLQ